MKKIIKVNRIEEVNDFFEMPTFYFKLSAMWKLDLQSYFPAPFKKIGYILEIIYRGFLILNSMHLFFVVLIQTIIKAQSAPFIEVSGNFLNTAIIFWNVLCVLPFFMYREENFKKLFALINIKFRKRSAPGLTFISMKKALNIGSKIMKYYIFACFVIVDSAMCLPFIAGLRILPFDGYYPFDELVHNFLA